MNTITAQPTTVKLDAATLLSLPECQNAISQVLIAERWIWTEADESTPAYLLAPRFADEVGTASK